MILNIAAAIAASNVVFALSVSGRFVFSLIGLLFIALLLVVIYMYRFARPVRRYEDGGSVSEVYDEWSMDQIIEHYWGGHLHAGFYGDPPVRKGFIDAKNDLVDEMLAWGLEAAPPGLVERLEKRSGEPVRILDVGCGLGASMRRIHRQWPGASLLTGITLSEGQARVAHRSARQAGLDAVTVLRGDALALTFPDESFDVVWSLECEPHIDDKAHFLEEMMRVLKPGGVLVMGTWNLRDLDDKPLTKSEATDVAFLRDEWNHAGFISIPAWDRLFREAGLQAIDSVDWTAQTLPTWLQAVITPWLRPAVLLRTLRTRWTPVMRDGTTLLRYDRAFRQGLMRYGVFRGRKRSA